MKVLAAILATCGLLLAAACGGGDDEFAVPTATPDAFDESVLETLPLQPADVPGYTQTASTPIETGTVAGHSTVYEADGATLQSAVYRITDPVERDAFLANARGGFIGGTGEEKNLVLEGVTITRGYAYRGGDPTADTRYSARLAEVGDFVIALQQTSAGPATHEIVLDEARSDALVRITIDRVLALEDGQATATEAAVTATPAP